MPDTDHVTLIHRLQRRPPECDHDRRVGHRLRYAGRPDRFETVLPRILARYAVTRLHEYEEVHAKDL